MKGFDDSASVNNRYNSDVFLIEQMINNIYTAAPVRVRDVDAEAETVVISPMVKLINGRKEVIEQQPIYNIPYIRIQGGKNALIIDPKPGDIGLAIFSMRDISAVKSEKKENIPGSFRKYNPADAVYIGGLLNGTPERYVKITDEGVEIEGVDNVLIKGSNTNVEAENVNVEAASTSIISPSTTITGQTVINGNLLINGGISWTETATPAEGQSSMRFNGLVEVTDDVKAGDISLKTHRHNYANGSETGTTDTPI